MIWQGHPRKYTESFFCNIRDFREFLMPRFTLALSTDNATQLLLGISSLVKTSSILLKIVSARPELVQERGVLQHYHQIVLLSLGSSFQGLQNIIKHNFHIQHMIISSYNEPSRFPFLCSSYSVFICWHRSSP